jgi:PIN domain nuclease of toxin-antitoxin system
LKILLDTHAFLFFVLNDPKLGPKAKAEIEDAGNAVLISPASYWEIAIKISVGEYLLNGSYEAFWNGAIHDNSILVRPIEVRHTSRLIALPYHHKDPFDRLLVAQALTEDMPLVSSDSMLDAYGVRRIW